MSDLLPRIQQAAAAGQLRESSARNIQQMLSRCQSPLVGKAVAELLDQGAFTELDNRFFKTLVFGTGGLRGRTIGQLVTAAEQGAAPAGARPEFPCVGTAAMNEYNVSRATQGLAAYLREWASAQGLAGRPKIIVAHDTRHFSPEFAALVARVASECGCDVLLFKSARSTPQLSFALRHLGAHAGVVLTASHNPPHDNGFKCYFADGAQVVEPHAGGIIEKVNAVESDHFEPVAEEARGTITQIGDELDAPYTDRLKTLLLDRAAVDKAAAEGLKIVFTPIHGTGGVISVPMLRSLGFTVLTVPEQDVMDGAFPTVKKPNPEESAALNMAIELAQKEGADVVLATDPDCDRLGVAVRNRQGEMQLLTGNQIGSLIAYVRISKMIGTIITPANVKNCVMIKTFVTTDLQRAIAEANGIRCLETLTGFKYIGAKLGKYEAALPDDIRARYRTLTEDETRAARLTHSSYYVCGGEESYGYSAHDFVRDKDGNASVLLFAEVAAHAQKQKITIPELLDEVYTKHGYFLEDGKSLEYPGADGAAKIEKLVASYAAEPPTTVDGCAATVRNFAVEDIRDGEGDLVPKENMIQLDLADGRRVFVRPSGTEPKIKYYLFGRASLAGTTLDAAKAATAESLAKLWTWVKADADRRLA